MVYGRQIQGAKSPANFHEEAARIEASRVVTTYENHEFDVIAPLMTPTSLKTLIDHTTECSCRRLSGAFGLLRNAQRVTVRNVSRTDADPGAPIMLRLNAPDGDLVTLEGGEYFDWDFVEVTDIFFENHSGQAVPTRVSFA